MSAGAGLAVYLPWQWVVLVVIGGCSCYIQVVVVVVDLVVDDDGGAMVVIGGGGGGRWWQNASGCPTSRVVCCRWEVVVEFRNVSVRKFNMIMCVGL